MHLTDHNISWPIAAASQVIVSVAHGSKPFNGKLKKERERCRLFYNHSKRTIELVPYFTYNADECRRLVSKDHIGNIENEPSYRSYLISFKDRNRDVIDYFHTDDVIGTNLSFECNNLNPNTFHGMQRYASCANINIFAYPQNTKGRFLSDKKKRYSCHKKYTIDPICCEDFADARFLIQAIRALSSLRHSMHVPIKYLVILNPCSGAGALDSKLGSKKVYETMVKPMFEQACVEHDILITRRKGHAQERMAARKNLKHKCIVTGENPTEKDAQNDPEADDISEYEAIIAIGGDGILFEIMQGIHARSDEKELMLRLKFGIVGCGTCNGLAKSLLHWSGENFGQLESIFQICKGKTSPLDTAIYQLAKTSKTYTSFLSFSWGLVADCDLESECIRWVGSLRQDIWAVYRGVFFQKKYRARLSYLPPTPIEVKDKEGEIVCIPAIDEHFPKEWITIEDDIIVFWACNVSHTAYNMYNCPMAKMSDGLFHILLVRASCSRLRLLQMLLKLESGSHIECKDLEVIHCNAYRLETLTDTSYNNLDGEMIESGPIQAKMHYKANFFHN